MSINRIIKTKREENNWTQKELAEKIDVSESAISRWESGEIDNMRRKNIVALSKVLNIKPEVLMGWEEACVKAPQENTLTLNHELKHLITTYQSLTKENRSTIQNMIDALNLQQTQNQIEKETALSC